jgi:L-alanine-DL-glutamate epimerase-like enolase superfamily enzyme
MSKATAARLSPTTAANPPSRGGFAAVVTDLDVSVYRVPTEEPESDGTLSWDATEVVVVEPVAGGVRGLGFSYGGGRAAAAVIEDVLEAVVVGTDATDVGGTWLAMARAVRNLGRPGIAAGAIAAVDVALWDLKARLLGQSLADLLGPVREAVPVYGSGGFTSYPVDRLCRQLAGWVEAGIPRVKMKVGRDPAADPARVAAARRAIGDGAELYVDANGAYHRKQAVRLARRFGADAGVTWFEEPVSSDDLDGLALVRSQTDLDVAAGEYGYEVTYFERMCRAGAVDVVQADVSRCCGITEWLRVAAVAAAHGLEVSGHCAQSLHAAPAGAVANLRHLEWFHDHARVDRLLFDGVLQPDGEGRLRPDRGRPGLGLALKRPDADRWRVA